MHTGEVRAGTLGCDPQTRQGILLEIIAWIEDQYREKSILWIVGPAGIGKSVIAMTMTEKLDHPFSKARIAGSFFFRNDARHNSIHYLVPILAHQLAVWIEVVGQVIERNLKILEAMIEVQWRKLVIEPMEFS